MKVRSAASVTLFTLLPVVSASAQFTTYVPPEVRRDTAATAPVATTSPTALDSAQRATVTNMKAWVDSAAGEVTGRKLTSTDTMTVGAATTTTTSFREGALAPETASPLPTIALFGGAALAVGMFLLRRDHA